MKKKILSMLLIAAMLASFASCSETTTQADEETQPAETVTETAEAVTEDTAEEESTEVSDNLPDGLDFDGYNVNFAIDDGIEDLAGKGVWVEEDTGDIVDSAVYNRNIIVEDRLNVKIVLARCVTNSSTATEIKKIVKAGTEDYDIAGVYQYYGIYVASDGYMMKLDDMPYNDFSAPYWGKMYMDSIAYKGTHFLATGDLALRYTGGMYVTYINSALWEDLYPGQSYYEMVDNGTWTLEKMTELSRGAYRDTNGNGSYDEDDQLGFYMNAYADPIEGLASGSMVEFSTTDDEGNVTITLGSERTYNFWEKACELLFNDNGAVCELYQDSSDSSLQLFATGSVLMSVEKLYCGPVYLRDMEDDYSIIPVPKLDESQDRYNTMLHDGCTLFGIPITSTHSDCLSAVLEAMASGAYNKVTPAYFDTALKYKYTRDADSARMIDLVKANVSADFAEQWSSSLSDIAHFFRNQALMENSQIASKIEKSQNAWDKCLTKLTNKLDKVAEEQS